MNYFSSVSVLLLLLCCVVPTQIYCQTGYAYPDVSEAEPNTMIGDPGIITLSQARTCVGSVPGTDADRWYLPVPTSGDVTITFYNPNGASNSVLTIASDEGGYGEGTTLAAIHNGESFSFSAVAGTYYMIVVTRDAGAGSAYYYFDVSGGTLSSHAFMKMDETEPNNYGEAGVKTITESTTSVGNLGFGDRDYWKLASGITGPITVTFHNPGGSGNANVSVYSNIGSYGTSTFLATVYDGAAFSFTAVAGTYYIFGAYKYLAPGSGEYSFDVTLRQKNLLLHLRADNGVVASGSLVSQWTDGSLYGNNATQTVPANQPTYVENALNGLPVVRFNGSTSNLMLPTATTLGIQNSPYEVFFVARSSTVGVQFLISGTGSEQYEYHLDGAAGARFIPTSFMYIDKGTEGTYTNGEAHVYSGRVSYTGGGVRVDGVDGGTSSATPLTSDAGNVYLGLRQSSVGSYPLCLNGDIAEVLIYKMNLTSTERDSVENALAVKYGITSGALPVELSSFTGVCKNGTVTLKWRTATEVHNHGFTIERQSIESPQPARTGRSAADEWTAIGFVRGSGNSSSPKTYSFADTPSGGSNFRYRLQQIDADGRFVYSDHVDVSFPRPAAFALQQNYPNPFNPATEIRYQLPMTSHVSLKVFDILGKEVAVIVNERKEPGSHTVRFDGTRLSSGLYFYSIKAGAFTVTKKFILAK